MPPLHGDPSRLLCAELASARWTLGLCCCLPLCFLQEEQRELANTIRVSGSILLSTVSNFLDFFKLEAVSAAQTSWLVAFFLRTQQGHNCCRSWSCGCFGLSLGRAGPGQAWHMQHVCLQLHV